MLCRLSVIKTWQYSNKKVDIVAAARNQILSDTRSSYVLFTGTRSNGVLVYIFDSIFFSACVFPSCVVVWLQCYAVWKFRLVVIAGGSLIVYG
jgi:hypothetical protein